MTNFSKNNLWILGTITAASFAVSACTNIEDMPGPGKDKPKICTREYAPVCGGKGIKRKTFSNACQANAAGYSVIKEGKCLG